jgi:hypothetical protein
MGRLVLASRGIPDLASIIGAKGRNAILVTDAADPVSDPRIPAEVEHELRRGGLDVLRLSLAASTAQQVRAALTVRAARNTVAGSHRYRRGFATPSARMPSSSPARRPAFFRAGTRTLRGRRIRPHAGEWEVRGDARAETRFHFGTGITSVVPWLVVSRAEVSNAPIAVPETAPASWEQKRAAAAG